MRRIGLRVHFIEWWGWLHGLACSLASISQIMFDLFNKDRTQGVTCNKYGWFDLQHVHTCLCELRQIICTVITVLTNSGNQYSTHVVYGVGSLMGAMAAY